MRAIKEELCDNDDEKNDVAALERKMQSAGMPSNIWKHVYRELSFSLDKWSGKNCCMISARGLHIVWTCTSRYWRYVSLPESRFGEVAELLLVCWLEIHGKIDMRMLFPSTMHKAYLLWWSLWVWLVENPLSRRCYWTQTQREVDSDRFARVELREMDEAQHPKERADGWLEVELGEFFCEGEEYGVLEMDCMEIKSSWGKRGRIVEGIEVRPKRM